MDVPNVLGDVTPTPVAGTAVFKINGQELRLTDLGGDAAKELFFVFSDPTSKTKTYPGGRFLKAGPVSNGTVVLDFNRAYNPPCSVTPMRPARWRQRKTGCPSRSRPARNTTTNMAIIRRLPEPGM